jgi:hypothetical protein
LAFGGKKNSLFNEFVIECISFGYGFIKRHFSLKDAKDNKGSKVLKSHNILRVGGSCVF